MSDLAPLQGLSKLQSLHCSCPQVSDLGPLKALADLKTLVCSQTQVSNLAPLQGLSNLQTLDCSQTQVRDLAPLQGLSNLQMLVCSQTQVRDLAPLQGLSNLQTLDLSECRLFSVPETFWFKDFLETVRLHQTHLPGIPPEVLSQSRFDDCIGSLRAHLRDLEAGAEVSEVNLMVLGNGRIGKTQICRRLRGEEFDESIESTHGILVTAASLPQSRDDPERLEIWDFGGQDIYLGTHALFMRSRAVFLLVWIPEAETTEEYRHGGIVFRNRPLAYWLDYVKHFGGTENPVLMVQTRCERPEDEIITPPVPDAALTGVPFKKLLHATGHGVAEQELFLIFMQHCGICFAYRSAQPEKGIETEYIAPDFLPEKSEIALDLAAKWDADLPSESAVFEYSMLHPGLMRGIISRIGRLARRGFRLRNGHRQPRAHRRGGNPGLGGSHPRKHPTRPGGTPSKGI